jgi:hypothetical protein
MVQIGSKKSREIGKDYPERTAGLEYTVALSDEKAGVLIGEVLEKMLAVHDAARLIRNRQTPSYIVRILGLRV